MAPPMRRNADNQFVTDDHPEFRPNLSPKEMFQAGIFGGTYFRDISIDGTIYKSAWREFQPHGFFDGLNVRTQVACKTFDASRNKHGVSCGQSLDIWLEKGWILAEHDSHGWVHWYCRFFLGRRCADDDRQIARWLKCAGDRGRWRRNLIAKCVKAGKQFDDPSVSPVVRQTLLHWAYELTSDHHDQYKKMIEKGHRTSFIPQIEMQHVVKRRKKPDATEPEPSQAQQEEEDEPSRPTRRRRRTQT